MLNLFVLYLKLVSFKTFTKAVENNYFRLIPHSPATEPWELKKFLNCVKMASERLKEDGGKFDEKRFVKSVRYYLFILIVRLKVKIFIYN